MIKKLKRIYGEYRKNIDILRKGQEKINAQVAELEWAHIFHDTIKSKEWLKNVAISPGRWAGNYSFFYLLVRILADYKPETILEFGLGESTKIVSSFLENELDSTSHMVIEQEAEWIKSFSERFLLTEKTSIACLSMRSRTIKGFETNVYEGLENAVNDKFDLYIIDGPFGAARYSRYQICDLAQKFENDDEFMILIDDYNRQGEKDTANDLMEILKNKKITFWTGYYSGNKGQILIATSKYRYATSM